MCTYFLRDSRVSVLVVTRCLHESNCKHHHSQGYPLVRLDAQLNANIGAELWAMSQGLLCSAFICTRICDVEIAWVPMLM
jgi:hypothetical protein